MNNLLSQFLKLYKFTPTLCVLIVLIATQNYFGQDSSQNQTGCTYLAKEKPSVFISYAGERTEQNEKGQNVRQILLRLHNNSSCKIIVETNSETTGDESLYKKEVTPQADGVTIIIKYIPTPPKDFEIPVSYDIQESKNKAWKAANYWEDRHLVFGYPIFSGYSAIFPVNEKHFRKRFSISVPFTYDWEHSSELVSHRVFYFYDFPQGFYKG